LTTFDRDWSVAPGAVVTVKMFLSSAEPAMNLSQALASGSEGNKYSVSSSSEFSEPCLHHHESS
jgi:hypothetical protein